MVDVIYNAGLSREKIDALVRDFVRTRIETFEALNRAAAIAPELEASLRQDSVDRQAWRRRLVRSIASDDHVLVRSLFDEFLEARGVGLDRAGAAYQEVVRTLALADLETIDAMDRGCATVRRLSRLDIMDSAPCVLSPEAPQRALGASSKTIADLTEPYLLERDRGGIGASYARDIRTAMDWFAKWFGPNRAVATLRSLECP